MPAESILNLARQVDPKVEMQQISLLQGGFSSQAYKINRDGNPFVLLVERQGGVSSTNYGHAYTVLTLLQRHDFKYAPQPLWLKDDHKALAISLFDGVASDKFDFNSTGTDALQLSIRIIDSLLDTASITWQEYEEAARDLHVTPVPVEEPSEAAFKYGTRWFEIVKKSCPDQDIVEWLEPRVQRSVKAISLKSCDTPKFSHGDPSNPNILIRSDDSFMLIDWDSARFHCSWAEYLVAYTTHLTDFMGPFRKELVAHVAERLDIPEEFFAQQVYNYRRDAEIFDVNWAAMMMAKVSASEVSGDIDEFRTIAKKRIEMYEVDFEGKSRS